MVVAEDSDSAVLEEDLEEDSVEEEKETVGEEKDSEVVEKETVGEEKDSVVEEKDTM
jgi:hypothetical protein